jgi:hypothetical protein
VEHLGLEPDDAANPTLLSDPCQDTAADPNCDQDANGDKGDDEEPNREKDKRVVQHAPDVVRPGKAESDPICEDEKKEQTAGRRKAGGDAASACDQTCETIAIGRGILGLIEAPRPRVVRHVACPF